MRDVFNAVAAAAPVTLYSYMDNLYIVGAPEQVIAAFASVKQQLQSVRLECSKDKSCFIYFHDEAEPPLPPAVVSALDDDGIEIKRDHAEVLGAIIGANAQAIIDGLMSCKPMEDMEHFFRRLRDPNLSAQAALRVLSKCGVPKLDYLLRCHPPACSADHAKAMDAAVLSTATHLLDISKQQQRKTGVKWQLQVPLRFGGHGLTSAVDSAASSYYGSVLACSFIPHIQEELQSWAAPDSAPLQPSQLQRDLDDCITSMKANISDSRSNLVRIDLLPTSASETIPHYQQYEKVMPFVQQEVTAISN